MQAKWVVPVLVLAATSAMCADKKGPAVPELEIGQMAPEFSLPGTDGKTYTFKDVAGKQGTLVVFTCNHCPYAIAYQQRIIDLTTKYSPHGLNVVAISSNDAKAYPDDGFEMMKVRADSMKYNFPYLFDGSQAVALKYGPKVTPHVFLFDAKGGLVYRGRIDDAAKEKEVKKRELAEAIDALIGGKAIPMASTTAFGCSIKWKPEVVGAAKKSGT